MEKQFFAQCYLKRNTPELRKKLLAMGYIADHRSSDDGDNIVCDSGKFYVGRNIRGEEKTKFIDCGVKEKLFLAMAALRRDSDYGQLFVAEKLILLNSINSLNESVFQPIYPGDLFLCDKDNISTMTITPVRLPGENKSYWHKATELELKWNLR